MLCCRWTPLQGGWSRRCVAPKCCKEPWLTTVSCLVNAVVSVVHWWPQPQHYCTLSSLFFMCMWPCVQSGRRWGEKSCSWQEAEGACTPAEELKECLPMHWAKEAAEVVCGSDDGSRCEGHSVLTVIDCSRLGESSDDCDTAATELGTSIGDLEVEEASPVLCDSNSDEDVHMEPQTRLQSVGPC